jgi:short-subunit dehydrogenase
MAARGVEVWLAARRKDRLDALAGEIGGHAVALDVSDPAATAATVEKLDAEVGGFDLVLANAGAGGRGRPFSELTWQEVAAAFQTNTIGAAATLLPVVPRMIARGRGHIAAVSSLAAETPIPIAADYNAAKAGLTFFLACAQAELPRKGVDVTIIHPGFVKTDLTAKNKFPMPFLLDVDEAAKIVDDGLAERARYIRFPAALAMASTFGRMLPSSVRDAIIARNSPKPR